MSKALTSIAVAALLSMASASFAQDPSAATVRMPELPSAEFDETLAIGGEEIGARKLRSRMTVDVMVNGTGPHKFVGDSGSGSSVFDDMRTERLAM